MTRASCSHAGALLAVVFPGLADGGTPIVRAWNDPQGAELLTNGSFETGGASMSPWTFRHDVSATLAAETVDVSDGTRARCDHDRETPSNPWLVQLRQGHLQLQAGTIYTLSVLVPRRPRG